MKKRPPRSFVRWCAPIATLAVFTFLAGCTDQNGNTIGRIPQPQENGPCVNGTSRACGITSSSVGGTATCIEAQQVCRNNAWGECGELGPVTTKQITIPSILTNAPLLTTMGIADSATACVGNPCDPGCETFNDTPDGALDGATDTLTYTTTYDGGVGITDPIIPIPVEGGVGPGGLADVGFALDAGYNAPCLNSSDCIVDQQCVITGDAGTGTCVSWTPDASDPSCSKPGDNIGAVQPNLVCNLEATPDTDNYDEFVSAVVSGIFDTRSPPAAVGTTSYVARPAMVAIAGFSPYLATGAQTYSVTKNVSIRTQGKLKIINFPTPPSCAIALSIPTSTMTDPDPNQGSSAPEGPATYSVGCLSTPTTGACAAGFRAGTQSGGQTLRFNEYGAPLLIDLDGDKIPEIIAPAAYTTSYSSSTTTGFLYLRLMAFKVAVDTSGNYTATLFSGWHDPQGRVGRAYASTKSVAYGNYAFLMPTGYADSSGPTAYDLDGDGVPEIIWNGYVFNASGLLLADRYNFGADGTGIREYWGQNSVVGDFNLATTSSEMVERQGLFESTTTAGGTISKGALAGGSSMKWTADPGFTWPTYGGCATGSQFYTSGPDTTDCLACTTSHTYNTGDGKCEGCVMPTGYTSTGFTDSTWADWASNGSVPYCENCPTTAPHAVVSGTDYCASCPSGATLDPGGGTVGCYECANSYQTYTAGTTTVAPTCAGCPSGDTTGKTSVGGSATNRCIAACSGANPYLTGPSGTASTNPWSATYATCSSIASCPSGQTYNGSSTNSACTGSCPTNYNVISNSSDVDYGTGTGSYPAGGVCRGSATAASCPSGYTSYASITASGTTALCCSGALNSAGACVSPNYVEECGKIATTDTFARDQQTLCYATCSSGTLANPGTTGGINVGDVNGGKCVNNTTTTCTTLASTGVSDAAGMAAVYWGTTANPGTFSYQGLCVACADASSTSHQVLSTSTGYCTGCETGYTADTAGVLGTATGSYDSTSKCYQCSSGTLDTTSGDTNKGKCLTSCPGYVTTTGQCSSCPSLPNKATGDSDSYPYTCASATSPAGCGLYTSGNPYLCGGCGTGYTAYQTSSSTVGVSIPGAASPYYICANCGSSTYVTDGSLEGKCAAACTTGNLFVSSGAKPSGGWAAADGSCYTCSQGTVDATTTDANYGQCVGCPSAEPNHDTTGTLTGTNTCYTCSAGTFDTTTSDYNKGKCVATCPWGNNNTVTSATTSNGTEPVETLWNGIDTGTNYSVSGTAIAGNTSGTPVTSGEAGECASCTTIDAKLYLDMNPADTASYGNCIGCLTGQLLATSGTNAGKCIINGTCATPSCNGTCVTCPADYTATANTTPTSTCPAVPSACGCNTAAPPVAKGSAYTDWTTGGPGGQCYACPTTDQYDPSLGQCVSTCATVNAASTLDAALNKCVWCPYGTISGATTSSPTCSGCPTAEPTLDSSGTLTAPNNCYSCPTSETLQTGAGLGKGKCVNTGACPGGSTYYPSVDACVQCTSGTPSGTYPSIQCAGCPSAEPTLDSSGTLAAPNNCYACATGSLETYSTGIEKGQCVTGTCPTVSGSTAKLWTGAASSINGSTNWTDTCSYCLTGMTAPTTAGGNCTGCPTGSSANPANSAQCISPCSGFGTNWAEDTTSSSDSDYGKCIDWKDGCGTGTNQGFAYNTGNCLSCATGSTLSPAGASATQSSASCSGVCVSPTLSTGLGGSNACRTACPTGAAPSGSSYVWDPNGYVADYGNCVDTGECTTAKLGGGLTYASYAPDSAKGGVCVTCSQGTYATSAISATASAPPVSADECYGCASGTSVCNTLSGSSSCPSSDPNYNKCIPSCAAGTYYPGYGPEAGKCVGTCSASATSDTGAAGKIWNASSPTADTGNCISCASGYSLGTVSGATDLAGVPTYGACEGCASGTSQVIVGGDKGKCVSACPAGAQFIASTTDTNDTKCVSCDAANGWVYAFGVNGVPQANPCAVCTGQNYVFQTSGAYAGYCLNTVTGVPDNGSNVHIGTTGGGVGGLSYEGTTYKAAPSTVVSDVTSAVLVLNIVAPSASAVTVTGTSYTTPSGTGTVTRQPVTLSSLVTTLTATSLAAADVKAPTVVTATATPTTQPEITGTLTTAADTRPAAAQSQLTSANETNPTTATSTPAANEVVRTTDTGAIDLEAATAGVVATPPTSGFIVAQQNVSPKLTAVAIAPTTAAYTVAPTTHGAPTTTSNTQAYVQAASTSAATTVAPTTQAYQQPPATSSVVLSNPASVPYLTSVATTHFTQGAATDQGASTVAASHITTGASVNLAVTSTAPYSQTPSKSTPTTTTLPTHTSQPVARDFQAFADMGPYGGPVGGHAPLKPELIWVSEGNLYIMAVDGTPVFGFPSSVSVSGSTYKYYGPNPTVASFAGFPNPTLWDSFAPMPPKGLAADPYNATDVTQMPPNDPIGAGGGSITVADFDGDGMPEIGIAGGSYYVVFDLDCIDPSNPRQALDGSGNPIKNAAGVAIQGKCDRSAAVNDCGFSATSNIGRGILWCRGTQDQTSFITSSSVFDFNADGVAEVMYADECWLRIYEGTTGQVLFSQHHSSETALEQPMVADVDGDGRADLVMPSTRAGEQTAGYGIACPNVSSTISVDGAAPTNVAAGTYLEDKFFQGLPCNTSADCPTAGMACTSNLCRCTDGPAATPSSPTGHLYTGYTVAHGVTTYDCDPQCGCNYACMDPLSGTPGSGKVCGSLRGVGAGYGTSGIQVFSGPNGGWAKSRNFWNEHAYTPTNFNNDGTFLTAEGTTTMAAAEAAAWTPGNPGQNSFREQLQAAGQAAFAAPSLTVEFPCTAGYLPVCNRGDTASSPNTPIGVFNDTGTGFVERTDTNYVGSCSTGALVIQPGQCAEVPCSFVGTPGADYAYMVNPICEGPPCATNPDCAAESSTCNSTTGHCNATCGAPPTGVPSLTTTAPTPQCNPGSGRFGFDEGIDSGLCIGATEAAPAVFQRLFVADTSVCGTGTVPQWSLFTYDTSVPSGTNIQFDFRTSNDATAVYTAPAVVVATAGYSPVSGTTVVGPSTCAAPTDSADGVTCPIQLTTALTTFAMPQKATNTYLLMEATLNPIPGPPTATVPILNGWNVTFDCVDDE